MVEALIAMPAIGPAAMRIGVASGGHEMNSQNIILGTVAADRLQSEQAISSFAKDLRTYQQEFDPFDFSVISQVKLKVGRDHMVRNMLTGNEEVVDTLVSEEGVPAETFIWEGDAGGRVYEQLLDKYHKVASSRNDVTALWVSYLPENAKNSGRNNRIYKLEKVGSDVILTSYTAGGSEKSMRDFMDNISGVKYDRNSSLHSQTAFFSPREDDVSHRKVYDTLFDSLTVEEKVKSTKYLDCFSRELGISDAERNARNVARDKMYADMMREKMLEDNNVKTAFALVAQAVAFTVESNYHRAESDRRNNSSPVDRKRIEAKEGIIAKKDDVKSKDCGKDEVVKNSSDTDRHRDGIIAAALAVISGEAERLDKEDGKTGEAYVEEVAENVFEPVIPILQAILAELVEMDFESEDDAYEITQSVEPQINEPEDFAQKLVLLMFAVPSGDIYQSSGQKRRDGEKNILEGIEQISAMLLTHFERVDVHALEAVAPVKIDEIKSIGELAERIDSDIAEPLTNVKILLLVYKNKGISDEIKEIVSLFLFHELVKIYENREVMDKYPQLLVIFSAFEPVFGNPIFKRRYKEFILCIEKLFSSELLRDDGFRDFSILELLEFMKTRQYTSLTQVCIGIYPSNPLCCPLGLQTGVRRVYTIERLSVFWNGQAQNTNPKKKNNKFPIHGIIYQYLYQVVPIEL